MTTKGDSMTDDEKRLAMKAVWKMARSSAPPYELPASCFLEEMIEEIVKPYYDLPTDGGMEKANEELCRTALAFSRLCNEQAGIRIRDGKNYMNPEIAAARRALRAASLAFVQAAKGGEVVIEPGAKLVDVSRCADCPFWRANGAGGYWCDEKTTEPLDDPYDGPPPAWCPLREKGRCIRLTPAEGR